MMDDHDQAILDALKNDDIRADMDVAARTVYGEARGEPDEGKIAVAWVIRTRAANQT